METKKEINELEVTLKEAGGFVSIKSPIKRFNYFWKDKAGKELSFKEFMARFKKGLEGITPLQQVKAQMNSTLIMLIGILLGIVVSLLTIKTLWWLLIILVGAFFNTLVQYLGLWQKKKIFERIEKGVVDNGN